MSARKRVGSAISATLLLLGISSVATAEIFSGTATDLWGYSFGGSFPDESYQFHGYTLTRNTVLDADWSDKTVTLNTMEWPATAAQLDITRTNTFTVGPGQTKTLTMRLQVASSDIQSTPAGPFTLSPATGGLYEFNVIGMAIGPVAVQGHYEITGPSESLSGDFTTSLSTLWSSHNTMTLDTSSYPDSIAMHNPNNIIFVNPILDTPVPLFACTVDSVPVVVSLQGLEFITCGDATLVPEPCTLCILALGGLAMIRRRR